MRPLLCICPLLIALQATSVDAQQHYSPTPQQLEDCKEALRRGGTVPMRNPSNRKRLVRDPCWMTTIEYDPQDPVGSTQNLQAAEIHGVRQLKSRLGLTGRGINVGVWDDGLAQPSHREFEPRLELKDLNELDGTSCLPLSLHATHVSGTIGALGRNRDATGMAPGVTIFSFFWSDDVPELHAHADSDAFISVSNHSYGIEGGWGYAPNTSCKSDWFWNGRDQESESVFFGAYIANTAAFDRVVEHHQNLSIFVAAGNERSWVGDPYKQPANVFDGSHCIWTPSGEVVSQRKRLPDTHDNGGYDTIGGIAAAKNVITIGAMVDITESKQNWQPSDLRPTSFSSFGPIDDGRIKPDLLANGYELYSTAIPPRCAIGVGCQPDEIKAGDNGHYFVDSGTSMAAPVASGIAALLNELALKKLKRVLYADEMKAVLVHTARETRRDSGPTYQAGWGVIQADIAGNLVESGASKTLRRIELSAGQKVVIKATWPQDSRPARVTAVWIDPPGQAVDELTVPLDDRTSHLVHDLDLAVQNPDGSRTWWPWSLNPARPTDAPTASHRNRVDNVERIDIPYASRTDGEWTVSITAPSALQSEIQHVALVVSGLQPSN